ncbi:MAG: SIMPL domain-containing protein [Chloroflexota bacterium]
MKKLMLIGVSLLVLVGAVFLAGCQGSVTTLTGFSSQQQGIWVTGQGEVPATPDIFNLSLGIDAQDATVDQAQAKATDAMNRVISTLKSNGVAEKDIQTQHFSIGPVTKWDDTRQEPVTKGYQVSNMVVAKIRNLDKAGDIIDAVARAGGDYTRVNSIGFDIEDKSTYNEQAREKAMADALSKAQQLAKLAGVTLGKPTFVSESVQYNPSPISYRDFAAPQASSTPISPGELKVSTTVQVTYDIVP